MLEPLPLLIPTGGLCACFLHAIMGNHCFLSQVSVFLKIDKVKEEKSSFVTNFNLKPQYN